MKKALYLCLTILFTAAVLTGCFGSESADAALDLEDSLMRLEDSGSYSAGFNQGYADGYPDGYDGKKPGVAVNSGEDYMDGYALGYADGADSAARGLKYDEGFGMSVDSGWGIGETVDITEGMSIAAEGGGSDVPVPANFFEIKTTALCGAAGGMIGLGNFPGSSSPGCLWIWGPAENYDLAELCGICEQVDSALVNNEDFRTGGKLEHCGNWCNARLYGVVLPPVEQRPVFASQTVILADDNSHLPEYFRVSKYPTLIVFEPDGRVIGRYEGYSSAEKTYQQIIAAVRNEYGMK